MVARHASAIALEIRHNGRINQRCVNPGSEVRLDSQSFGTVLHPQSDLFMIAGSIGSGVTGVVRRRFATLLGWTSKAKGACLQKNQDRTRRGE